MIYLTVNISAGNSSSSQTLVTSILTSIKSSKTLKICIALFEMATNIIHFKKKSFLIIHDFNHKMSLLYFGI